MPAGQPAQQQPAEAIDTTKVQAISQHLAMLEDAALVASRSDGRYKFHSVDTAPLREAVARWLDPEVTTCRSAST